MATKRISIFSLLSDETQRHTTTDAQIAKATDAQAVKAETSKHVTALREALKALPEDDNGSGFAAIVADFRETFGSTRDMARDVAVQRAALKVMSSATRVLITEAHKRDLIGKGKTYGSANLLAEALGVTPGYVSQVRSKVNGGAVDPSRAPKAPRNGSTEDETVEAPAATTTDTPSIEALQQALTRLESASKRAFTPGEAEDVRRVANALRAIAARLDDVAKVAPAA